MRASSRAPTRTESRRYRRTSPAAASMASITSSSERCDERPVQALNDLVRQLVALVLGFLDLVGLVPRRALRREHLLEQPRAAFQLVGKRLKVGIELFFPGNQSKVHGAQDCSRSFPAPCYSG